ncbi:4-(cytidine 5'-diphospho)-2-C-methyl-D-erythritol kinase [Synechococcus sp. CS-1324]|uniref:4-(cytidine 5'-diphospho)-2-C-methyl-D-erythritol kinase n=1 Tax=unclassified Synechococcus TaxID=2626047 RepID=UPI0021A65568|nr:MULTISPECIES: 4-(cytidine 5'-diphospho)-2-C-methyl-D-erythritol kinase [unclassified Synechococcus]MCT0213934.1 4-(cytidine 5'-diphospho)-2-C-methyl-D-erythritol kinase [Synechococcus sp. CS-1326]MCT0230836.1 4-(cytidine 5'-diphospho)-2-C-methyl-D-erythritol kinase [Synechococcus sp. CS-1324]MCT0233510.1 4-(cytidine 5'-diphospho)-2-C-methyl-D-erythritol kinase [Synechococcus sp. CS-1327]
MADLHALAPAKINLHLEVLGLRPDGFHELAMVMQSLELADSLALSARHDGVLSLSCDQPGLPTDGTNLIVRAAELLRRQTGQASLGADLVLTKRIPIGAGLAGGSSDGAAALLGLNQLWELGLGDADLRALAAELGSDVPFCLVGGTQLCFGRGERLEPVDLGATEPLAVLLIKDPAASVSTPWAYGRCRELRGDFYLQQEVDFEQRRSNLRHGPLLAALRGERALPPLRNDLQAVVEPEQASVRLGLALLRQAEGQLGVAMSGSGPSLFALFADLEQAEAARSQLGEALDAAGFDAWCCLCSSMGARPGVPPPSP